MAEADALHKHPDRSNNVGTESSSPPGNQLWRLLLLGLIAGAVAGMTGIGLIPPQASNLGAATISTDATLGRGRTVVQVPLFGTISASTHSTPLRVTVGLQEINLSEVEQGLATETSRARLAAELEKGLRDSARSLSIRLALGAAVIGAVAAALLPGRRALSILAGGVGGFLAAGALLVTTGAGFDVQAFQQPQFNGAIERAPQIIQAVQRRAGSIENLKSRFTVGADRLSDILALASQPNQSPDSNSVAILHISDIHSNPLGLELAKQMAGNFKVDAIVDTGDLTSFGQPIEGRIGELLVGGPVPYLFVPGNHDSDANRAALAQVPGVTVLHDAVADVKGVKIMGWADPSFTASNEITNAEGNERQRELAPIVGERVKELSPDVLAVHNPLLASSSIGEVPLVLAGHHHVEKSRRTEGTLTLQVGSAGATGLGSFVVVADHDYEAQIVYFRAGEAVAVDYIRFRGLGADFEIQRRTLSAAGQNPASAPGPSP